MSKNKKAMAQELERLEMEQELAELEQLEEQENKRRKIVMRTAPVLAETSQALEEEGVGPAPPINWKETAQDAATVLPMGASLNWADELMPDDEGEAYKQRVELARRRSPIATMATELAGTVGTAALASKAMGPVAPMMAEGSLAREGIIGGVSALGASEAQDTSGKVIDTGIGAGLGMGATIVGRALKAPFKDPGVARARAMGATKPHFRFMRGAKDPSKVLTELKDAGLLIRDGEVAFDPNRLKFSRTYGKGMGPKISRTNPMAGLAERAESAGSLITDEIDKVLSSNKNPQKVTDIVQRPQFAQDIKQSVDQSVDRDQMREMWKEEVDKLLTHMKERGTDVKALNEIKHTYQTAARKIYNNPNAADDLRTRADIHADIARNLKEFVEDTMNQYDPKMGARLKQLNDMGFKMHIAADILNEGAQSHAARGWTANVPLLPQLQQLFGMGLQAAKESPEATLMRASIGEKGMKIPMRPQLEDAIKQYPGKDLFRGMYEEEGSDTMALPHIIERTQQTVLPQDRSPQSLVEQIVRKPFPRTSQGLIQNRSFVLAKLAQQAPEMFDTVRDVIDLQPEKIPELMPVLTLAAPHLFSHDKFNRWDGKISDPHLKDLARKEIMDDNSTSNTEKALLMNRLNKTGEY